MKILKPMWAFLALTLMMGVASSRATAAPFDQAFIDAMTPHHQGALMMAQMAITKAQLPEVKRMARDIIADQKKEIAQMQAWRKAWYGSARTPQPHMMGHKMKGHTMKGHTMKGGQMMKGKKMGDKMMMPGHMMGMPMKGEMDMSKLKNAKGRDFDKLFLQMMIPHHAGAIIMAQEALNVTARPQIRKMSHAIISSQGREIGQMQNILDRRF